MSPFLRRATTLAGRILLGAAIAGAVVLLYLTVLSRGGPLS